MDYKDVIVPLTAITALIISLVSLSRTRKFNARQIAFQEEANQLHRMQKQILEREIKEKEKSEVSAYIYIAGSGHRLGIKNTGNAPVTDVNIDLIIQTKGPGPLDPEEIKKKLPIKQLDPNAEINLVMTLPTHEIAYEAILTWKTKDGETHSTKAWPSI